VNGRLSANGNAGLQDNSAGDAHATLRAAVNGLRSPTDYVGFWMDGHRRGPTPSNKSMRAAIAATLRAHHSRVRGPNHCGLGASGAAAGGTGVAGAVMAGGAGAGTGAAGGAAACGAAAGAAAAGGAAGFAGAAAGLAAGGVAACFSGAGAAAAFGSGSGLSDLPLRKASKSARS
jgi:hypothetical protein